MDPDAALVQADQDISDGDLDSAADRLFDYYQWRVSGGFEPRCYWHQPEAGDQVAAYLVTRLQDARED